MTDTGPVDDTEWTARRIRASWSSVLLAIGSIVAVVLVFGLVEQASQPIGWVLASATAALVVTPVVGLLARWMPRGVAILATVVAGIVILASVGVGLVIEIQDQLDELGDVLPDAATELEESDGPDGVFAQIGLGSLVDDLVDQSRDRIAPDPIDGAVGTAPAFFVSGVLVIFLIVWGPKMFAGLCRQIDDPTRRERFAHLASTSTRLTQGYVVGSLAVAALVGVAGGLLAWWAGLPTPLVLGVVLGIAGIVPYIGVLVGGTPLLLLSAAFESLSTTVTIGVAVVALQVVSTLVTRRVVERRSFRVGPAIIVIAALIGSDVYGIGGALVAIVGAVLVAAGIDTATSDERSEEDTDTEGGAGVGAEAPEDSQVGDGRSPLSPGSS